MIANWLARMNQRERILALAVAGILFLLINLAIWNALLGMSAGARDEYASQSAARAEQKVYLTEEEMWRQRADWLEKKQPKSSNPAEASSLLTRVKEIAGRYKVQIENPQIGPVENTPSHHRFPPPSKPRAAGNRSSISSTTRKNRSRLSSLKTST